MSYACPRSILLLLPLLTGCAVHLITPYDSTLDSSMTQVQQDTELFFVTLKAEQGTDAASYESNKTYYLHAEATLQTLLTRAQAAPNGDRVAAEIDSILKTVETMQAMHARDATLNPENLAGDHDILKSEFRSFFTLELALKTRITGRSRLGLSSAKGS